METIVPSISMLQQMSDAMYEELEQSSDGKKTSLAFVKNPLSVAPLVNDGERFQVMALGATVFHNATGVMREKSFVTSTYVTEEVLLFSTKQVFLEFIAQHLDDTVAVLSLNFGFPITPITRDGRLDGILFRTVKEHEFKGLVDEAIGMHIEQYIKETTGRDIRVVVANDVVCLVLSGSHLEKREHIAGAIVGSGYNMGFFLDNDTIVNLESGNFNKFPLSVVGKEIDETSATSGKNVFEKEISGVALFLHFNRLISREGIDHPLLTSTKELDKIAAGDGVGSEIARDLLRRSAAYFATQIVGMYRFKGNETMTFVMEGSVFWKGWRYKEMVEEYLPLLGVSKGAVQFVSIENSTIMGAAALVA